MCRDSPMLARRLLGGDGFPESRSAEKRLRAAIATPHALVSLSDLPAQAIRGMAEQADSGKGKHTARQTARALAEGGREGKVRQLERIEFQLSI